MDAVVAGVLFLAVVFVAMAFALASVRRRVGRLENMVLRLQDRLTDATRHAAGAAVDRGAEPSAPIDIEAFVD